MKWLLILALLFSLKAEAKEIKMIVAYSAGGPIDLITRTVAKHLSSDKYKFIPEYRIGAGGAIALNHLAAIKDDTAIMVMSNALVSMPVMSSVNYNIERDFALIDFLGYEPLLLVVNSKNQIKTYKQFQQYSKTNNMPYGSGGVGTSGHITAAIVAQDNKNFFHVPYKGSSGIVIDLLNDNIKWMIDSETNVGSFIQEGKVQPLAVYSNKRLKQYPQTPTLKELGVDDREFYRWFIVIANKNADPEIVKYVASKLEARELKEDLVKHNLVLDKPNLKTFFLDETVKIRRIVRDIDLK